jgi:hypothetical protein
MSKKVRRQSKKLSLIIGSLGLDCDRASVLKLHKHNHANYERLVDKCDDFLSYYDTEGTPVSNIFLLSEDRKPVVTPFLELDGLSMYEPSPIREIETPREFYEYTQTHNIVITPNDSSSPIQNYFLISEEKQEAVTATQYLQDKIPVVFSKPCTRNDGIKVIEKRRKSIKKILKRAAEEREDRKERRKRRKVTSSEEEDSDYVYSYDDSDDSCTSEHST